MILLCSNYSINTWTAIESLTYFHKLVDFSESDTNGDEYSTEEEEIMPTCTPRETATIVQNTGIIAMSVEKSTTSHTDDQTPQAGSWSGNK